MAEQTGMYKVPLAALDTGGGVLSVANPEGVELFVTRVLVDVTTPATGVCTVNAGIAAAATTSSDNLLDGLDVGTAAILADNVGTPGTNGKAVQAWAANQFLTISMATGAAAGLVGNAYIEYTRVG